MENKNVWKIFLKGKKSVLLLFALAVVSSTLYAIYLEKNGQLHLEYVESYLGESNLKNGSDLESLLAIWGSYFKKYLLVWLLGSVVFLSPIVVAYVFMNGFAYGFSMASMYLVYGKEGVFMAGHLFVVQGLLFMVLLLKLTERIFKKNELFYSADEQGYLSYLLGGVFGCVVISLIEFVIS